MILSAETKKNLFKNIILKKYQKNFRLPVIDISKLPLFNILCEYMLHAYIKVMSQREIIKTKVNPGDSLKSILNV